jgi:hypothetical protein
MSETLNTKTQAMIVGKMNYLQVKNKCSLYDNLCKRLVYNLACLILNEKTPDIKNYPARTNNVDIFNAFLYNKIAESYNSIDPQPVQNPSSEPIQTILPEPIQNLPSEPAQPQLSEENSNSAQPNQVQTQQVRAQSMVDYKYSDYKLNIYRILSQLVIRPGNVIKQSDPFDISNIESMYQNCDHPYIFSLYIDLTNVGYKTEFISDKNMSSDRYDLRTIRKSVIEFTERLYDISVKNNKKTILPNGYMGSTVLQVQSDKYDQEGEVMSRKEHKNIYFALVNANIKEEFDGSRPSYSLNISSSTVDLTQPYYIICCGYNPKYTDLQHF